MKETPLISQEQLQSQKQKIDPKLIQANTLLQLSGIELQQAIEDEVLQNPALEMEDENPCRVCELQPFGCRNCRYIQVSAAAEKSHADSEVHTADYSFDAGADFDEEDPIGRISAEFTLQEYLRQQLGNACSGKDYDTADYLVNYINESGYLDCNFTELPLELDASEEEIAGAVKLIQSLDPPGIGARDLRECLLVQLRYLADENKGNALAERIVSDYWDEMVAHRTSRIAQKLKVKQELVTKTLEFIQTKLNPYPAAGFRSPWDFKPSESVNSVRPDVIIHRTTTGYEIEIVANEYPSLTINPQYSEIRQKAGSGQSVKISNEDLKHILQSVERAEIFIGSLSRRRKTLRNITKYIVEYQHGFLATGSKLFLRPLTRAKVAEVLEMHESTISRAVSNKYVQLPSHELVSFDLFFQSSQGVMDVIADLLSTENSAKPMSDQYIAENLAERGFSLSRRTVAKYRKALKILSSHRRRS